MSKKSGLPRHSTEIDMDSAWDNGENERRVKSPATKSYFSKIYAWVDNGADDTRKSSYRFIHHMVAADGTPGPANMRALSAAIGALNGSRRGTVLDDAGRRAVYSHISAHYEDADRTAPPLLSKSEIDSIYSGMETKSSDVMVGSQVRLTDEENAIFGTIVSVSDGMAIMREWIETDDDINPVPTETMYDVLASSLTLEKFLADIDPDDDDEDDEGESTLPYCEQEKIISNIGTLDIKDSEMTEQDFEVLVKSIAKLVIAEVGVKIDPPAGFSNKPAVAEDDTAEETETAEPVAEAAKEVEAVAETAEAAPAEEAAAPAEEVAAAPVEEEATDAPAEEAKADSSSDEAEAKDEAEVMEEKSIGLTLADLKEFSDLVKML